MQLLSSLSHMPYLDGETLLLCYSGGAASFSPKQTVFDITNAFPPRVTNFQPWQIARLVDGHILPFVHSFRLGGPYRIFCNPVASGASLSFIFSRQLYIATIAGDIIAAPRSIFKGVFTGFSIPGKTVLGKMPCAEGSQVIVITETRQAYNTAFEHVLRIVPSGNDLIFTGKLNRELFSILYADGVAKRITANGQNVYKCCLSADRSTVIHAVRTEGFEERYLHTDAAEFVDFPDFIRE